MQNAANLTFARVICQGAGKLHNLRLQIMPLFCPGTLQAETSFRESYVLLVQCLLLQLCKSAL